jgi:ABC-type dipeptide/oligopeptide/nickel transport system permease component
MWHVRQAFTFGLGLLRRNDSGSGCRGCAGAWERTIRAVLARLIRFRASRFRHEFHQRAEAAAVVGERLPATLELMTAGAIVAFVVGAFRWVCCWAGDARCARQRRCSNSLRPRPSSAPGSGFCGSRRACCTGPTRRSLCRGRRSLKAANASLLALHALALPGLTVGAAGAAAVQLAVRRAEAEAIEEPYRHGLKLLGLGSFEIDRLYLAPQILAGMLASFGEIVLALFSAAAVAEWLFGWPGAAVLFLKSVALHDWNVTALVLLAFAAVSLTGGFLRRRRRARNWEARHDGVRRRCASPPRRRCATIRSIGFAGLGLIAVVVSLGDVIARVPAGTRSCRAAAFAAFRPVSVRHRSASAATW